MSSIERETFQSLIEDLLSQNKDAMASLLSSLPMNSAPRLRVSYQLGKLNLWASRYAPPQGFAAGILDERFLNSATLRDHVPVLLRELKESVKDASTPDEESASMPNGMSPRSAEEELMAKLLGVDREDFSLEVVLSEEDEEKSTLEMALDGITMILDYLFQMCSTGGKPQGASSRTSPEEVNPTEQATQSWGVEL